MRVFLCRGKGRTHLGAAGKSPGCRNIHARRGWPATAGECPEEGLPGGAVAPLASRKSFILPGDDAAWKAGGRGNRGAQFAAVTAGVIFDLILKIRPPGRDAGTRKVALNAEKRQFGVAQRGQSGGGEAPGVHKSESRP